MVKFKFPNTYVGILNPGNIPSAQKLLTDFFDRSNECPSFANRNLAYFTVICERYNESKQVFEPFSTTSSFNNSGKTDEYSAWISVPDAGTHRIKVIFSDVASTSYFNQKYIEDNSLPPNTPVRRVFAGAANYSYTSDDYSIFMNFSGWENQYYDSCF